VIWSTLSGTEFAQIPETDRSAYPDRKARPLMSAAEPRRPAIPTSSRSERHLHVVPAPAQPRPAGSTPEPGRATAEDRHLEEFCRRHEGALHRYVRALTYGDGHLAEDIVQETFIRAWRQPQVVADGRGAGHAWLHTVARNIVIDQFRSRGCRPQETADTVLPSVPDPVCHIDRLVSSLALREALTRLTARQREILVELYYRDRGPQEVAAALGIPVGTVKSRAHYALRALRAELTGSRPVGTEPWAHHTTRRAPAVSGCRTLPTRRAS
jgi:RNA polymerase sigma-70 factor, ECF subfamily